MIDERWFQNEAVNSIFSYYASGKTGNPVVAMPTASGKSVVIAKFLKFTLQRWSRQRVICATHVKELIEQNCTRMLEAWPEAPAGVYSAGLNRREFAFPIVFGGVQSMVANVAQFGWRDLLLVDEAHLISGKETSNYGKLIAGLKEVNPNLRVIGFSATPWRLGHGHIAEGPIFTDVCYDLCSMENFNRLIDEGFLCKLIPKRTKVELSVVDVKIQAGDYVQKDLQAAVDKDAITYAACKEIIAQGANRRSWLIFGTGIEHAEHIAQTLQSFGITAAAVHSKLPGCRRDELLANFRNFRIQAIVTNNICTTGFDHRALDLIAVLRPTVSTVLWVQMLGRGMRTCTELGKNDCLVLDFAGNTKRLGPVNDPVIPRKRGASAGGVPPVRICEACGTYNHARSTHCICCGVKFEFAVKITTHADTSELIRRNAVSTEDNDNPIIEQFNVDRVIYHRHESKTGGLPMIKVSYWSGLRMFFEWVCLEHSGLAGKKAQSWFRQRVGYVDAAGNPIELPTATDEALKYIKNLRVPKTIRVWVNKRYPEILGCEF